MMNKINYKTSRKMIVRVSMMNLII